MDHDDIIYCDSDDSSLSNDDCSYFFHYDGFDDIFFDEYSVDELISYYF